MQYASLPQYTPSGKFSLPGMLLTLVGGIAAAIAAGLILYLVSLAIPVGIPMLFPAILGGVVGYATLRLGSTVGHCRNQILAISVAVIAGVAAWSSRHIIDYVRFRSDVFATIAAKVPQASPQSIDGFIDQLLHEETGQSGFIGFILLKAGSESVEITGYHGYGATIGRLKLTGPTLILYWLVELIIVVGLAGYINRSYSREPYCDQCNVWRKYKTLIIGSIDHVDEAIEALQRRDITTAVRALGTYDSGDLARLEMEFCPACCDNSYTRLMTVRDTEDRKGWLERTVWSDRLDPGSARRILELAH